MALNDLEKQYLYHKHESNRLRFFNKPDESAAHAAMAIEAYGKFVEGE